MKVKRITKIGKEPVYNMQVKQHHNFAVNGGNIVHNCDAFRYFAVMRECVPIPQDTRTNINDAFFGGHKEDKQDTLAGDFY